MAEDTSDTFFDDSGEGQDREDRQIRKAAFRANFKKGGKNLLILFVCVAGLTAWAFWSGSDEPEAEGQRGGAIARGGQGEVRESGVSENSPIAQRQAAAKKEQIEDAKNRGETYMEKLALRNEKRQEERQSEESTSPSKDTGDLALESVARAAPKDAARVTGNVVSRGGQQNANGSGRQSPAGWNLKNEIQEAKDHASQIESDLKKIAVAQGSIGAFGSYEHRPSDKTRDTGAGGSTDSDGEIPFVTGGYGESLTFDQNPSGASPSTFKVPPDTRLFGLATVGHNSDVGGPMSFESVTPPLDGAVFIAEDVQITGEAANPKVTTMIYRGESYSVRALVVNAQTFQPGIASDVDHHYLSRWVPYLLGTFGGAYAETLTNKTVTTTPEGNTVNESSGVPDPDEQLAYTVGTGLGRAVPILQEQINRPVTVTVRNNEEVGIWILSEIEVKR